MFVCRLILFFFLILLSCQGVADMLPRFISASDTPEDFALKIVDENDSDRKKAYKIAEFIASYYERDGFLKYKREEASRRGRVYQPKYKNNFFMSRVGSSLDFALLYQKMCLAVGLDVEVVEGYAGRKVRSYGVVTEKQRAVKEISHFIMQKKDETLERYRSAWNIVRVDGEWILVDTFWMIKGEKYALKNVSSERQMTSKLKRNEKKPLVKKNVVYKKYFDISPHEMIKTHFPDDEKYQLLTYPIKFYDFLEN